MQQICLTWKLHYTIFHMPHFNVVTSLLSKLFHLIVFKPKTELSQQDFANLLENQESNNFICDIDSEEILIRHQTQRRAINKSK